MTLHGRRIALLLLACLAAGACGGEGPSAGDGQSDDGGEVGTDPDVDADPDDGRDAADADADADGEGDAEMDADGEEARGLVVTSPMDGDHYFRLEPVTFAGYTPGVLEVFADVTWPLGGAEGAGDFEFTYAFNGTGARPISFVVDGELALEMTLNIDPNQARVCLDPGHPSTEGDKLFEAIINRKVAFYLEDMLIAAGYDVLITVDDISREEIFAEGFDNEGAAEQAMLEVTSLDSRVTTCNGWPADYFISLHHNAVSDTTANYTLTIYGEDTSYNPLHDDAVTWAELTTDRLLDAMEVTDGYVWGDRSALGFGLYVLQNTDMIGILTEASFYSNPAERERQNDNDYLHGEADAIFNGFLDFVP
jgi:N-acetylmuramoyl-L-alanine amidase